MPKQHTWGSDAIELTLEWDDATAPQLRRIRTTAEALLPAGTSAVEILTAESGHQYANSRLTHTPFGTNARLQAITEDADDDGAQRLHVDLLDHASELAATWTLVCRDGIAAFTSTVTVRNLGDRETLLRSVPSLVVGIGDPADGEPGHWTLHQANSDWMAETRWTSAPLSESVLPNIDEPGHRHWRRGAHAVSSNGTWSTGEHLPAGVLVNAADSTAWAWQIDHNGSWRWEIGEDTGGYALALSGPTDADHHWAKILRPHETFSSVPATIAFGTDLPDVVGSLTSHRRAVHIPHPDLEAMPIVFNDYMNTLNGDPTTEKLLPLVAAASATGAEVFVIDAGWYDETGAWWDSVGEWVPSTTRFPSGLSEVIDSIRGHGMTPGLWIEPEVIGVRSPIAAHLPDAAFISRNGHRIVEHERFHLDFRSPDALAHVNAVIDRLVDEFHVGYFKFDYNIDPHTGSDHATDSTGDALLEHNRAYLQWITDLYRRHPGLVIENCGSGGMRADTASTALFTVQSTSDQQNPLRYPPIAASAPMTMLPEQAASWAYPQADMTREGQTFTLVTGLAGRLYLSGYLNRMSEEQLALIRDAVTVAKTHRFFIRAGKPFWPLGLPRWDAQHVALGLIADDRATIAVWDRTSGGNPFDIDLPQKATAVTALFPVSIDGWTVDLLAEGRKLRLTNRTGEPSARLIALS
ncbi:MAG: glycoside hydrolase family 36 protein [Rhodococcus sp. (in: high G+C Gram-positive bacteria)]